MPLEQQEEPGLSACGAADAAVAAALRGRRCWVVGSAGFLGACLLASCRAVGMQALGVDAAGEADVRGDALCPAVLAAARRRLEPELIVCCAATRGGDAAAYRAVYGELPRALQVVCPAARVVLCSSSSVYGGQGGEVVAEGSLCRAVSARARVLQEAEAAVLAAGGYVARLVPLYGAGRCELWRRHVQREPELPGADGRWLNYVHRADAARGLLYLASRALGGECSQVVNVCAESFTKGEVYAALAGLTGLARVGVAAEGGRRGLSSQRVSAARLRAWGWVPRVLFRAWVAEMDVSDNE